MATVSQLFLNLSVKRKLFSGFALVLAVLLAVCLLSFKAINVLSERFSLLESVSSISMLVSEARQQEKNYIMRHDPQYIAEANTRINESLAIAEKAISRFTTEESIALMRTMQDQARAYQRELANYQNLDTESRSRQESLELQAQSVAAGFAQLQQEFQGQATTTIANQGNVDSINRLRESQLANEANTLLMDVRRHERNFIQTKDANTYQLLQQQLDRLEQLLPQLAQASLSTTQTAAINTIKQQLTAYRVEFNAYRQLSNQVDSSEQQLTTEARGVVADAERSLSRQNQLLAADKQQINRTLLIASIVAAALGLFAAGVITNAIVKPLQQVVAAADKIAAGDLTTDLQTQRTDELGQLINAMQRMTVSLRQLILRLSSGISQLASSTEEMAVISQQTSAGVMQQRVETEQVATAMNEMTATVQDVARSAEDASHTATQSAQQAEFSNAILDKTMQGIKTLAQDVSDSATAIAELQAEASSIGEIVNVISGITEQTNLLALNAAIEAARAGEAGRGFSVVADEVRQLANRAQQSTKQIGEVIKRLQQKTEHAVSAMQANANKANDVFKSTDDATDALEQIIANIKNIQGMNQQIAAAALQQSTVAEEINRSITNIRVATEQSSVAIDETARTSTALSQLGLEQQQLANQFRLAAA